MEEKRKNAIADVTDVVAQSGVAALAAIAGGPLAAMLPPLANSLSFQHYKQTVTNELRGISETLWQHQEALNNLKPSSFKLLSETVVTVLQTLDQRKLEYLRRVVVNSLNEEINDLESYQLARIIRDISGEETEYLLNNFQISTFGFGDFGKSSEVHYVSFNTREAQLINGLVSIGVLVSHDTTQDTIGLYRFARIAGKLIALLKPPAV